MSLPRVSQETIEAYMKLIEGGPKVAIINTRQFQRENRSLFGNVHNTAQWLEIPSVDGRTGIEYVYGVLQLEIDRGGVLRSESKLPIVSFETIRDFDRQPQFEELYRTRMKQENPELDAYADVLHNMTSPLTRGTAGFLGGASACYTILRIEATGK
ncbi:MAG TPA: hypothetical protein VJK72_00110 [Candidatus Nanoarchaeia archaeon]|nr:hypothetical protein [Candidatus Nanoarchaeia archaeon]